MTDKRPEEAMERVLTDGEVEACWRAWKGDHHVELIRKVEEMVLLKYPLPYSVSHPKQTPRTVTLSDGSVVSRTDTGFRVIPLGGDPVGCERIYGWAKTPEDAEALADLVRHPLEVR